VCVERRFCGAAASDEVPAGASAASVDSGSSPRRRGEVVPVHCQLCSVAAAARWTPSVPAAFPAPEVTSQ